MRKFILLAALCFFGAVCIPAQEADSHEFEEGNSEEIFQEEKKSAENSPVDLDLQKNFTVIFSGHQLDLNPYTANFKTEAQVLNGIYEGLYDYNPQTLEPIHALAESEKISRDKKRWTFTLRKGATFSDGSPITAQDFKDSWLTLLKTPNAAFASFLDCVDGAEEFREGKISAEEVKITVKDERTLSVILKEPTAHLKEILCLSSFAAYKGASGIYSGAYTVKESTEKQLVLVKNEKYWDKDNVYLPQITVKYSDNLAENSWNFNSGDADWLSGVADVNVLFNKNAVRISAMFGTEYIFFSCKNKPWDSADFRNALLTAVPWDKLRAGVLIPATSFIYPLAGYPNVIGLKDTEEDYALSLMQEARKKAGIPQDKKLEIIYAISTESERQKDQAEILKKAWEPLGVELKVQTTPESRYFDSIPGWNADLFLYSWIGDFADPVAFLELFREGSTLNTSKWKSQKFNDLLHQASTEIDISDHYKTLSKAEQILLDDGIVLPISHFVSFHAVNLNAVGGWFTNALDIHPFKSIYLKQEKTSVPNVVLAK